jgi:hypothetical protein
MFFKYKQRKFVFFLVFIFSIIFVSEGQQTYRLLAIFTPSASNAIGGSNVRAWINAWAIIEVNLIYSLSADPGGNPISRVELAAIDSVTYTEVDMVKDLDSMRSGTGVFANVPTLRDRYSADVVLLVTNKAGYTGVTRIPVPPNYATAYYAFTVANYDYILNRFSSAHETGHMFGGQHSWWDPAHDAAWLYGHGWGDRPTPVNPNGTWGTVMCYNYGRQPYFSNPDQSYSGHPCGKADSADNARVHFENAAGINNFRTTPASVTYPNDTIQNQEYGDAIATNSISSNGIIRVRGELRLRAIQAVTINSGFTVDQSGILTVAAGTGALGKKSAKDDYQPRPETPYVKTLPSITSFDVRSNNRAISVRYSLPKETAVTFKIFDLRGKIIIERNLELRNAGNHSEKFRMASRHSQQMYAFIMIAGNTAIKKIVLLKG